MAKKRAPAKDKKYAHIVGLPKFDPTPVDRKEAIELLKTQINNAEPRDTSNDHNELDAMLACAEGDVDDLYQLLVTAVQDKKFAGEYARVYALIENVMTRLADFTFKMNTLSEAYYLLLLNQLEVEGIDGLRIASTNQLISTWPELYATVSDKDAFMAWVKEQKLEGKLMMHHGTLNSLVTLMRQDGEPDPPGVSVFNKTKLRLAKA